MCFLKMGDRDLETCFLFSKMADGDNDTCLELALEGEKLCKAGKCRWERALRR
jgi:hypothetical protein